MRPGYSIAAILLLAGTVASVAVGAGRDDAVNPAAVRWLAAGDAALAAKKPADAIDAFEAALAVDPKNAAGFIGLAKAYEAEALPGRAIRYYREALALQPNDLDALAGQGEALIARGATTRARVNLDRIRTLCKADCPAAKRLETALAAPPPKVLPTPLASNEPTRPVVTER
jgi:Tfp pilus assembly protein PilF